MPDSDFAQATAMAIAANTPAPVSRRTPLDDLREVHPDLADRLADLSARILDEAANGEMGYVLYESPGEIRSHPSSPSRAAMRLFDLGDTSA